MPAPLEFQHLAGAAMSGPWASLQPHPERQRSGYPQLAQRREGHDQSMNGFRLRRDSQSDTREGCPLPGCFCISLFHRFLISEDLHVCQFRFT